MASFSISYTATTVTFVVDGLTVGDNLQFYVRLEPEGSELLVNVNHDVTSNPTKKTFGGLSGNTTYAANVGLKPNGQDKRTPLGIQMFTTPPEPLPRPSNWYWTSTVNPGNQIALTAAEWNNFCARINDFRDYKNLNRYSFTTVHSGTTISAAIVNQARTAINGISGHGTLPAAAIQGGAITASFFHGLQNALNAIA